MHSYSEYRAAAWKTIREGNWVMKYLVVWLTMMAVIGFVSGILDQVAVSMEIQTWGMFLVAKAQALQSGLDLSVPSRTIALRMTEASAFKVFITSIFNGISIFAVCGLFLRAAKGEREGWFSKSFGGFKCPLGVAWLYFRMALQIVLWSLLFVIPGIMAYYRYCQCWNLKVENPDWSAGKCLAESARMMDGHKAQRFALDLSYWKVNALWILGLFVLMSLAPFAHAASAVAGTAFCVAAVACLWGGIVLAVYMSIGQAMFYLDLKVGKEEVKVKK